MTDDPRLAVFGQYTPEQALTIGYGDHYLFFVGRDDVHSILMWCYGNEKLGIKGNMYGYDDPDINGVIMNMFSIPSMSVQMTLDKAQAGGVAEKKLIALDRKLDPVNFNNSFAIGESATHMISHTKATAFLGLGMFVEGSTNYSVSGEGTGISLKVNVVNPKGFKAQNNTLLASTNPVAFTRLCARLDVEHAIAKAQMKGS